MKKIGNFSIPFHIIAVICICIFCVGIAPKTLQNDTYYTIPIGKYIAENGISDLTKDKFSWHNLSYTYPHWLYDLTIFLIFNSFGHLGLYISTMVFASILGIMIYVLSNKKSRNKWVSLLFTIWALYSMKDFIAARAYSITFILFAFEVYSIEKYLETKKKRYALYLILIPLLIANVHCAVFAFYYILYLPYLGEYAIALLQDMDIFMLIYSDYWEIRYNLAKDEEKKVKLKEKIEKIKEAKEREKKKREELREHPKKMIVRRNDATVSLFIIMVLSILTGFINPAGNTAFTYLYKTLQGNTTGCINEHLPITLMNFEAFAFLLITLIMVLVFTDDKVKLSDFFMLAGLTYMAFSSRRQVAMFAIICVPIIAGYVGDYISQIKAYGDLSKKIEKFACTITGSLIIICCFTLYTTQKLKDTIKNDYVNENDYPVQASTWILNNLDVENMRLYNEYNYGSYLLFRGIPVFIDSRADLYAPEFNEDKENGIDGRDIFMDVMRIDDLTYDYEEAFKHYGVTHVILYTNSKLTHVLELDSNYKSLYKEGNFEIFERLNRPEEKQ